MSHKPSAEKKFSELKHILSREGFTLSNEKMLQYNFECEVKKNNNKIKLQVYFGKAGVKIVLQGNPESEIYKEADLLISGEYKIKFNDDEFAEPDEYIGTDESGKGDYFGPLVTSAVFVNPKIKSELIKFNVRDSKELSDNQINIIASKIKNIEGIVTDTILITPQKYNSLYEQFGNLNKMLNWSHSKCIENLFAKTQCKVVISDKFSNKELPAASKLVGQAVIHQIHKAEKYIAVAAASILARHEFNIWFERKKHDGLDLLKGSSEAVTLKAREIAAKLGEEALFELVKLHFKTSKKIF